MKYRVMAFMAIIGLIFSTSLISILYANQASRFHQHRQELSSSLCDHDSDQFCSAIPKVFIYTNNQPLNISLNTYDNENLYSFSNSINGSIKTIYNYGNYNHLTDSPSLESFATISYRGNSSLSFDKKSYKIDLTTKDGLENELSFLGMSKHDEWVLNGPFLDKTLMRNYLCMNIAGEIMADTPDVRFCELYKDDEYQGLYVAMESISRGKGRVDISRYNPQNPYTSYILQLDRNLKHSNSINSFSIYSLEHKATIGLDVEYPSKFDLNDELKEYITNDFSLFEKTLYSFDYDDLFYGYNSLINTSSFVDYFIINEFFSNSDAGIYSTFFYKDLKDKIHIGPLWDFNNSMDNYMESSISYENFNMIAATYYKALFRDERFVKQVIYRYKALRKGVLSEEYLLNYIDEVYDYIDTCASRNYQVWGYSFQAENLPKGQKLLPNLRNPKDYDEAINQMKNFIIKRGQWLDEHIEVLSQYSHKSFIKNYSR